MGSPRLPVNKDKDSKIYVNARMAESLWKKVGKLAHATSRTKTWIIEQALQEYLDKNDHKLDH